MCRTAYVGYSLNKMQIPEQTVHGYIRVFLEGKTTTTTITTMKQFYKQPPCNINLFFTVDKLLKLHFRKQYGT